MKNYNVLIMPDETATDLTSRLCDLYNVGPNEPFCFSAIAKPADNPTHRRVKINALDEQADNPYTIAELVMLLYEDELFHKEISFIQPPLELWLVTFKPLLLSMVDRVYSRYERLIPDREEQLSILYLSVIKLYNQKYYLHKTVVYKTFVNDLNYECRKLKGISLESLDAPVGQDDDGKDLTLLDKLADPDAEFVDKVCKNTDDDYWHEKFLAIKERMLQDMSELAFERILIQLMCKSVDRGTAYQLDKYRALFNPGYVPRPNARGKNRGGKKV